MIYGTINAQNLKIADTITAADTYNALTAKFCFSKEWSGLEKIAYFRKSEEESCPFLLENDCIPARAGLNLSEGEWEVSVRGYDLKTGSWTEDTAPRLTTNIAMLHVCATLPTGEGEFPEIPKSLGEQILTIAAEAKETAADVERRANAGEFNGRDGNDYDHSEEYARLATEIAEYGEQVAADRAAIHSNVVEAAREAEAAAGYAEAAAQAATTAEGAQQSATAAASNANTAASAAADSLQELKDGIERGDFKGKDGAPLTIVNRIYHIDSDRPNWETLIFSDGSELDVMSGKNGKDGADGKDGKDGKDGVDGKDGKVPDDIILVDGTPSDSTHMLVDTDGEVIEVLTAEDIAGLYAKPMGGIPESDLSADVRIKLNSGGGGGDVTKETVKEWGFAEEADLAAVATSGSYNDLADKPSIPAAVTESTVSGWGFAYKSEIPNIELLAGDFGKVENAVFSAPVYPVNGGTQYEILTGYFNPGGTINYQKKWARTLYLTNGIRDGNMLLISCPSNWLMRFTLVNYRTSTDMDVIENIPYQTESGAAIVRVPSGTNRLGISFKRASGDTSTDVTEEELAEISEGFKISEVPAPVSDQHIIDVITAAFPNAEGVGF